MAIEYTNWVYAPFPTEIDTVDPVVSFVSPPTPIEEGRVNAREISYQWTANKTNCEFRHQGSWESDWSDWSVVTTTQSDNLPNGNYSISVQARDQFGNLSEVTTRTFIIFRDLPIPTLVAPVANGIVDDPSVVFVCDVPRGENGQTWHFEFQISTNSSMTQLVDGVTWFSSINGYAGFSYNAPVPENAGGTVSFTKTLDTRTKYWWRCRLRLAGTNFIGAASEAQSFTVGILGTQLIATATPSTLRADGSTESVIKAEVQDALGRIDTVWTGNVTFSIAAGVANFSLPTNVTLVNGAASTSITSNLINIVNVYANANLLPNAAVEVNFVSNRLPGVPEWRDSTVNLPIVAATMATLTCSIPGDLDNDKLHFMIKLDTVDTFDSPYLFIAESRFSTVGWEYFDGLNWLAFPSEGVLQGSGLVRYTTTQPLQDTKKYYAKICAWDNYGV